MAGYNITFVPFSAGKPGAREVFADGFRRQDAVDEPG
jgi:hypothetical protein